MRDSMVFYRSFYDAVRRLPDAEFAKAIRALMEYGLNGEEPDGGGIEYTVFAMAKPQIDANNRRWENGKQGGRPTNKLKEDTAESRKASVHKIPDSKLDVPLNNLGITKDNLDITIGKPNVNVNVNDNDKKENTLKGVKEMRFAPPTLKDVREYCQEKGYAIDVERFVDFYSSKGWMVGKNKMKDWKAAVRNWVRSQREEPTAKAAPTKTANRFHNFDQRETDYDAMVLEQTRAWLKEESHEN